MAAAAAQPDDAVRITPQSSTLESQASGRKLATYRWLPRDETALKALVFIVHGYGHHGRGVADGPAQPLVAAGYGVFAMDQEGHGESEGLFGLVNDFGNFSLDVGQFVEQVRTEYPGLKSFLIGESMGGATCILATRKGGPLANTADGVVLVAPMVRISPKLKPPKWQIRLLEGLASLFPNAPITPIPDVVEKSFTTPAALAHSRTDDLCYDNRARKKYWFTKPRLRTATVLNKATQEIEDNMELLEMACLILHGKADVVTEPESSIELHERAASTDKTLVLLDDMPHGIFNCLQEGSDRTYTEILAWLAARV